MPVFSGLNAQRNFTLKISTPLLIPDLLLTRNAEGTPRFKPAVFGDSYSAIVCISTRFVETCCRLTDPTQAVCTISNSPQDVPSLRRNTKRCGLISPWLSRWTNAPGLRPRSLILLSVVNPSNWRLPVQDSSLCIAPAHWVSSAYSGGPSLLHETRRIVDLSNRRAHLLRCSCDGERTLPFTPDYWSACADLCMAGGADRSSLWEPPGSSKRSSSERFVVSFPKNPTIAACASRSPISVSVTAVTPPP